KEIKSPEDAETAMHTIIGQAAIASAPINEKINEQKPVLPATPLRYLGDHLKKIMIIVKDENAVHLNETDLGLLSSILNACKLTLADIALVNLANQPFSLQDLLETLPSVLVISFEVNSAQLKIKLPGTLYKQIILGETHLLFSNSLSSMQGPEQNAKIEKSKLWTALKVLFQL
ncbi:MAG: hypothetical protein ACOVJ8_05575, partial [Sediminibacterium sp.]